MIFSIKEIKRTQIPFHRWAPVNPLQDCSRKSFFFSKMSKNVFAFYLIGAAKIRTKKISPETAKHGFGGIRKDSEVFGEIRRLAISAYQNLYFNRLLYSIS